MKLLLVATMLVIGMSPMFGQANAPAQIPNPDAAPAQAQAQSQSGETTITGCLSKGSNPDMYVITDEQTGQKTDVSGTAADLAKHSSNHKVKLTGRTNVQAGKSTFQVTKLEHISATCEAKK